METIAHIVKQRREELGLSQEKLAELAGTSQATIDKIENERSLRSKFLPEIFTVLGLPIEQLISHGQLRTGRAVVMDGQHRLTAVKDETIPASALVGVADLPIYASVRGGAIDDSVLVSPEPIDYVKRPEPLARAKNGYGLYIVGTSMEPAFRQGDLALIHPNLPPKAGDEVVVCSVDIHGEHYAIIKLLTKVTAEKWHLKQYNPAPDEPEEFTLDRNEWPTCHLVVGTYRRR